MHVIQIQVSDEQAKQLHQLADKVGLSEQDLIQNSIASLLTQESMTFNEALEDTLKREAELFRRLS